MAKKSEDVLHLGAAVDQRFCEGVAEDIRTILGQRIAEASTEIFGGNAEHRTRIQGFVRSPVG
ncbi:MAG: hypothetical protein KCHDKBKB_02396 [Elusimicrobia bacterium]|nr:hypothetical protein [Elusimicrobiota bacterium]